MRYKRTAKQAQNQKVFIGASSAGYAIYSACQRGTLRTQEFTLAEGQRLDIVSSNFYGNPKYWWVIAAASGIGWQCQVPPGTLLKIPISIDEVIRLVG